MTETKTPTKTQIRSIARVVSGVVIAATVLLAASAVNAVPAHAAKRHPRQGQISHGQIWHGYGYLPGYRSPEQLQWQKARNRPPYYWYGYPQFYRGRWNGGGFGPCWTQTPIGNVWNCGK